MFTFKIHENTFANLSSAFKGQEAINNKLQALSEDPFDVAKPLEHDDLPKYYANAGRYCLLFDVDVDENIVYIRSVQNRAWLNKVITGVIKP